MPNFPSDLPSEQRHEPKEVIPTVSPDRMPEHPDQLSTNNKELQEQRASLEERTQDRALREITEKIEEPDAQTKAFSSHLLRMAHIPDGPYQFTQRLLDRTLQYGKILATLLMRHEQEPDPKKRQKILLDVMERIREYSNIILMVFLHDNLSTSRTEKLAWGKERSVYDLSSVGSYVEAMKYFARNDEKAARNVLERYVRTDILSVGAEEEVDEGTQRVIQGITEELFTMVRTVLFPAVQRQVREFADTGFFRSFWNQTKSTASFVGDWVSTPFSNAARDRMAAAIDPICNMSAGDVSKMAPVVRDLASIVGNVSLNNKQALALTRTILGGLVFHVGTMALTAGSGFILKGVQAPKLAVAGYAAAAGTVAAGRTAALPSYQFMNALSVEKLDHYVSERSRTSRRIGSRQTGQQQSAS